MTILDLSKMRIEFYNFMAVPMSPTGVLKFCLEYADSPGEQIGGVFESIRQKFRGLSGGGLLQLLGEVYDLRNIYVAHQEKELKDVGETRKALKKWIDLVVWLESLLGVKPATY